MTIFMTTTMMMMMTMHIHDNVYDDDDDDAPGQRILDTSNQFNLFQKLLLSFILFYNVQFLNNVQ